MSRSIRVDDEVYRVLQDNSTPFEPVWIAARRALGLDLPDESTSLSEFEKNLNLNEGQQNEPEGDQPRANAGSPEHSRE